MTALGVLDILCYAKQKTLIKAVGHKHLASESLPEHTGLQVAEDVAEWIMDKQRKSVLAVNFDVLAVKQTE